MQEVRDSDRRLLIMGRAHVIFYTFYTTHEVGLQHTTTVHRQSIYYPLVFVFFFHVFVFGFRAAEPCIICDGLIDLAAHIIHSCVTKTITDLQLYVRPVLCARGGSSSSIDSLFPETPGDVALSYPANTSESEGTHVTQNERQRLLRGLLRTF